MHPLRSVLGLAVSVALMSTFTVTGLPTATGATAELDLHAVLHHSTAFRNATGYSEYEREATAREVEVTLRHVPRLAGQRVTVFVNHKRVGTMLVRRYGNAHREWETTHHQYVPWAAAGAPIRIRTSHGTLIAAGRYYR